MLAGNLPRCAEESHVKHDVSRSQVLPYNEREYKLLTVTFDLTTWWNGTREKSSYTFYNDNGNLFSYSVYLYTYFPSEFSVIYVITLAFMLTLYRHKCGLKVRYKRNVTKLSYFIYNVSNGNTQFCSSCLHHASAVLRHCFITPNWCTQL